MQTFKGCPRTQNLRSVELRNANDKPNCPALSTDLTLSRGRRWKTSSRIFFNLEQFSVMTPTIVGSLMYTKGRIALELFTPALKELWKYWELRILVLLSLILQIILIFVGSRRKYIRRIWIRVLMWCAYLMANWVATVGLAVISNNFGDSNRKTQIGSIDGRIEITAFWAPFLLLHLGGPDTITAYSLEDNELWLRHLLGLGVQTAVVLYILFMIRIDTLLLIMSIIMSYAGIVKYGERIWVLRSASSGKLRDSMLTPPDPGPNYAKFMQEYTLKKLEGFHVVADELIEAQVPVNLLSLENNLIPDAWELVAAYDLLQSFKRLFVDLILGFDDQHNSQSLLKDISFSKAFKVVEIELGFMYDMLYTKATLMYSLKGFVFRFINVFLTSIVLGVFCGIVAHKDKHSNVDLTITFLLLVTAIGLEVYGILLLLSSDWTNLWLSKPKRTSIRKALTRIQLPKHPRWSNLMTQYNLLGCCLGEKPAFCYNIQKMFHIDKFLEKQRHMTFEKVPDELKDLIFNYCQEKLRRYSEKLNKETDLRVLFCFHGSQVLKRYDFASICWSTEVEFDQSILIWHVASDLCYYDDYHSLANIDTAPTKCRISKQISGYMMYLLVINPLMLPIGIGMIRFLDTRVEAMKFFEERKAIRGNSITQFEEACSMLLKVNTAIPSLKVKGDKSKSVLFEACRLASVLQTISDKEKKWSMISDVWVEMLAYAASQCRGFYHAQQLRRGGEFLSHVWLLMAHFGLTEQFQISQGQARAKLVVK